MLDDASKEGLKEALSLLPVSAEGSGLLITSHLIKTDHELRSVLALRADGAIARITVLECGILSEDKAMELFHLCGFKFHPEDAAIRPEVLSEIKVRLRHVAVVSCACDSYGCLPGHRASPCSCSAVCRVELPPAAKVWRQIFVCLRAAAVPQRGC